MADGYRNKNRGYQQLRVWEDAVDLYVLNCRIFKNWPFELKKVASQAIASADSVHRNIAEGYCRRSLREYLYYLNIALGSLGESVSGYIAYRQASQITEADFEALNVLRFKLENGLLKLVEALERKQVTGDWIDHLIIKESNAAYGEAASCPPPVSETQLPTVASTRPVRYAIRRQRSSAAKPQHSDTPSLHHSTTPALQHPVTPSLRHSNTPAPHRSAPTPPP